METAASIIAVVQLCETVIKYIVAVSGAKHEKQRLRTQIRDCSSLLNKLQDETDDPENAEEWDRILNLLSTPLAHLQNALRLAAAALAPRDGLRENLRWPFKEKDVEKMIEAIESGMSMVTLALNYTTTSLLVKISVCTKRNEKHLVDLKSALDLRIRETHLTLRSINGELESIQSTQVDVRGRVEELHGRQDTEEALRKRQRILDWLTPIDHASEQHDAISQRQKGTGEWLLRSQTYQDWLSTDSRTLFCPGIPGAGKTVFASSINADLWERYHHDPTVGLAHLFCNYKRHNEQTLEALLSGLLKQFVERQVPLPGCVDDLYEEQQQNGAPGRIEATMRTLKSVMESYSRVFIVIDALDECSTSHGCRTRLLSNIQSLQKQCHINILATSRFIPEITEKFKSACQLEIQADSNDVRRYLSDNISRLPSFVQDNVGLREEIVSKIVEAVRGMFLLAKLHLDSLIGKRSAKKVKFALNELATGSDAYDSAYDAAMRRIESQVTDQVELAKQALAFLTCARRPLSTDELREALGVEVGKSELDPDNYPDIKDILASCVGLITVDEDSGIIRLVHYTTQEYLERTLNRWFPDAQAMITNVCISYLSLDCYDTITPFFPSSSKWYDYSACHWSHHARLAPSCQMQVVDFLTLEGNLIQSYYCLKQKGRMTLAENRYKMTRITGLHVAVEFQLEATTAALLQLGFFDVHARDMLGRTALQLAAKDGYEAIVKLLLKYDFSLDLKSEDYDESKRRRYDVYPGSTALHFAAREGHISIVKTLLNHGATVDSRDAKNATSLHHAIMNGKTEIVKVLLKAKADISSTVWSTSYQPHRTTDATNLLERKSQKSLLSTAIVSNSVDIVKLFIDAGADVNEHADDNCPPLFYTLATRRGVEMMEMLLGAGADPNIMWRYDRKSLLMWCTHDWHPGTIDRAKLLLDAGADINHSTGFSSPSRSALGGAQRSGMPTVVQYLVERGADLKLGFALHELWYVNEKASDKYYMSNKEYGNIMSKEQSPNVLGNGSALSATEAVS